MNKNSIGKPILVAEIGCNHKVEIEIAKDLISLGASYAKFQKRSPRDLLNNDQYNAPHPEPYHSYGESYGAHREKLELNLEQHQDLKKYCEKIEIGYACSVWDLPSADEIISLNPEYIKVPSACNNNLPLLSKLRDEYKGEVHISLGMTTKKEEQKFLELFSGHKDRLVLYACTSGYPVSFEDSCLLEISRIKDEYGQDIRSIGFSGHHLGIAIDIAAYTLGAIWIERHFTKDRTWKGTDHAASLEPPGLSKLVRDLKATHSALTYKSDDVLEVENPTREKLKYRLS